VAAEVLGHVRRTKSEAKVSQRAPVARAVVRATAAQLDAVRAAASDLRDAGSIDELVLEAAEELAVEAHVRPPQPA
jgi:valyl-tRNA synthetase